MIKIEVRTNEVRQVTGTSAKSGKPYSIRDQEAWAFLMDKAGQPQPYPQRISLTLGDDQEPYVPGVYILSPASVYVGDFGKLMLGRPVLVKAQVPSAKAA